MQTVYYTTRNFIRSTGNVVDLAEYRRKLAQAEGSLAPAPRHTQAPAVRPFPRLVENAPAEPPKKVLSLPRLSLDSRRAADDPRLHAAHPGVLTGRIYNDAYKFISLIHIFHKFIHILLVLHPCLYYAIVRSGHTGRNQQGAFQGT